MGQNTIKVFISSTSALSEEREALARIIHMLGFQAIRMETWGAHTLPPYETSLRMLDSCNVMILLVSRSSGTRPPGSSHTYTELEYEHAVSRHIPSLIFFKASTRDQSPEDLIFSTWHRRLLRERVCEVAATLSELKVCVVVSLARWALNHVPWRQKLPLLLSMTLALCSVPLAFIVMTLKSQIAYRSIVTILIGLAFLLADGYRHDHNDGKKAEDHRINANNSASIPAMSERTHDSDTSEEGLPPYDNRESGATVEWNNEDGEGFSAIDDTKRILEPIFLQEENTSPEQTNLSNWHSNEGQCYCSSAYSEEMNNNMDNEIANESELDFRNCQLTSYESGYFDWIRNMPMYPIYEAVGIASDFDMDVEVSTNSGEGAYWRAISYDEPLDDPAESEIEDNGNRNLFFCSPDDINTDAGNDADADVDTGWSGYEGVIAISAPDSSERPERQFGNGGVFSIIFDLEPDFIESESEFYIMTWSNGYEPASSYLEALCGTGQGGVTIKRTRGEFDELEDSDLFCPYETERSSVVLAANELGIPGWEYDIPYHIEIISNHEYGSTDVKLEEADKVSSTLFSFDGSIRRQSGIGFLSVRQSGLYAFSWKVLDADTFEAEEEEEKEEKEEKEKEEKEEKVLNEAEQEKETLNEEEEKEETLNEEASIYVP